MQVVVERVDLVVAHETANGKAVLGVVVLKWERSDWGYKEIDESEGGTNVVERLGFVVGQAELLEVC